MENEADDLGDNAPTGYADERLDVADGVPPLTYGRRPPQPVGPQPDRDGYYPDEYYVPTDWPRVIIGGIAMLMMLGGIAGLGFYLFHRLETDDTRASDEVTTVAVYQCAGDNVAIGNRVAPLPDQIVGRSVGSDWLAFDNGDATPRQLWVRTDDFDGLDIGALGVVPCATSPTEFPDAIAGTLPAG